ncbi:MAG: HEPN domain-containing protein [Verrucomicrobiota bacterium]
MDESTLELVRDWLTRADHDLRSARALAALEDTLLDTAIYHCQQAAEKSMKAWLQSKDDPFPKTHDIGRLVKQAEKLNPGFSQFEKAASVLTPYVSAFRYPGGSDEPMPTREEFDEALQHAQTIYDFVTKQLPAQS